MSRYSGTVQREEEDMLDEVLSERVKRGVALLNERVPNWRACVDTASLDLGSGLACVLGQIFGSYEKGLATLGLTASQGREYGFETGLSHRLLPTIFGSGTMYRQLTGLWKAVSDKDMSVRIGNATAKTRLLSALT